MKKKTFLTIVVTKSLLIAATRGDDNLWFYFAKRLDISLEYSY